MKQFIDGDWRRENAQDLMKRPLLMAAVLTVVSAMASFAHCGTCDHKDDKKKDDKKEPKEEHLVISVQP